MYLGPLSSPDAERNVIPMIKVINGVKIKEFPASILHNYAAQVMTKYGRTIASVAEYRGMKADEVLDIIYTQWRIRHGYVQAEDVLIATLHAFNSRTTPIAAVTEVPVPDSNAVPMPMEEIACKDDTALLPTLGFRIAVPQGTHFPNEQRLQQRWEYIRNSKLYYEWRNVPAHIVQPGYEHE